MVTYKLFTIVMDWFNWDMNYDYGWLKNMCNMIIIRTLTCIKCIDCIIIESILIHKILWFLIE